MEFCGLYAVQNICEYSKCCCGLRLPKCWEQLLNYGANLNLESAEKINQLQCAEFIEVYMKTCDCSVEQDIASQVKSATLVFMPGYDDLKKK